MRNLEYGRAIRESPLNTNSGFRILHFPSGFTLIELAVVIFLIGIMLSFTLPRFHDTLLTDHTRSVSRRIIGTIQSLKEKSVSEQRLYILNVNMDTHRLWVTHESMSAEASDLAEQKGFKFPDDVRLLDVEYPGKGKVASGHADICFYKKGYSDRAFIHIEDGDNQRRSFLIETFLNKVRLYETYVGFEG